MKKPAQTKGLTVKSGVRAGVAYPAGPYGVG
jgi:hypothetical protein